ncbi:MAG: hypothetical protein AB1485_01445 [Candidatus Thermoplasmatota archaeon]
MEKTKILGIAVCTLLLLSTLSTASILGVAQRPNENIEENLPKLIINTTDLFGGGNFIAIKMRDAVFGVVYGNETNNNNITIVAITTRYLGRAVIYDRYGNYRANVSIPIQVIFAQRLAFLLEFRAPQYEQEEPVGMENFIPGYQGEVGQPRPVKAISLNRTWEVEWLTMDNDSFIWNFTLRATNLNYDYVWPWHVSEHNASNKLEKLEFTFHINATLESVNITVPRYNVTVQNGFVINSTFLGNESYNGTSITTTFKYDHRVEGWDFSYNNSKLALETHLLLGCHILPAVARWVREQFVDRIGRKGFGRCMLRENAEGEAEERINATTVVGFRYRPRLVTRDRIKFEDNWYRIGMFRWVSDVDVWDNETSNESHKAPIFFQLHGGHPILPWHVWQYPHLKGIFFGFLAKGAFIYPQGYKLYHDPEFSASALFYEPMPAKVPSLLDLLPLEIIRTHLIETAVAIIAVCALAAVFKRKKKG